MTRIGVGVLFVLAAASLCPRASLAADPATYSQAVADVKTLATQVRDRKSANADLIGSIEALEARFFRIERPADAPATWPVQVREWQEKALDQLFAALRAVEVEVGGTNARSEVNLRAARALEKLLTSPELLGLRDEKAVASLRADRARALRAVLTTDFGRSSVKDREVPTNLLEATFVAAVRTDPAGSFDWLAEEYVHTRSGKFEEDRLIAAQKAMLLLKDVPGKKRHEIVDLMVRIYSGTEASAKQPTPDGRTNKKFWDHVRVTTIAAVNHFATPPGGSPPASADGLGLTTMDELAAWWRAHKRPTDAVWK